MTTTTRRPREMTTKQRLDAIPPGENRANLARILYSLDMLLISVGEGRDDWQQWQESLAEFSAQFTLKNR